MDHLKNEIENLRRDLAYERKARQSETNRADKFRSLVASRERRIKELEEVVKEGIEHMETYVRDLGECDHSVNICYCGIGISLDRMKTALSRAGNNLAGENEVSDGPR